MPGFLFSSKVPPKLVEKKKKKPPKRGEKRASYSLQVKKSLDHTL